MGEGQTPTDLLIIGLGIDGGLADVAEGGQPSFRLVQLPELETRHPEVFQGEAEMPEIGAFLRIDHAEGLGICQQLAILRSSPPNGPCPSGRCGRRQEGSGERRGNSGQWPVVSEIEETWVAPNADDEFGWLVLGVVVW